ncbi:unnamed protein product, partial [Brugia timori]|uniref:Endo/exonuclease/phosphatase domain-containing protein n=1 Tax=Brugia timori TaxID=42155 RepID=A0A0R3Q8D8_9BILA
MAGALGVDFVAITEPYAPGGRISAPGWLQWIVGRSAILVRSSIVALQIPLTTPETVCVNLGAFSLVVTYASPNSALDLTLSPLEADLGILSTPFLLLGDLNCRTSIIPGYQTDQRGYRFEDFLLASNLDLRNPPTPTWVR